MQRPILVPFMVAFLTISAAPAHTQTAQTGTITGRVSTSDQGLAGVTVTFESPALQGTRRVVTQTNGDYISPFMPPGLYTVSFSLDGLKTLVAEKIKVSTQQARRVDAEMFDDAFEGEVTINDARETVSQQVQAQTTVPMAFQEQLAISRIASEAALLVPGVLATGPGGILSIAGAMSFENLTLVNGVVTELANLYIEDAVLETTTSVSAIPADYGRFQGGVINVLTKSGGNQFSGSFRALLSNDSWMARTPLSPEREDSINTQFEATFGGYIVKDALWFFLAGRSVGDSENRTTDYTLVAYPYKSDLKRYEAKLTWSITPKHRLVGTYFEQRNEYNNTDYGAILDLASLNPNDRTEKDMYSISYTGMLNARLFLEGLYSQVQGLSGIGYGSPFTDIIGGTLLLDRSRGNARYHTPTFCSAPSCLPIENSTQNWYIKASLFAGNEGWGTHDVVFGIDQYSLAYRGDNHQSGSGYRIYGSATIIETDDSIYPVFAPDGRFGNRRTLYAWTPIFESATATDFTTNSVFANDVWRFNTHWSFNIGVRYDQNDGVDSSGVKVADDSRITPRLGVTWDPRGDGDWQINAGVAQYLARLVRSIANEASSAGQPAWIEANYGGPCVNCEAYESGDHSNLVTQDEAIQIWYDWFLANGGTDVLPGAYFYSLPGYTPQIPASLLSPITTEWTVGVTKRLGSRGLLRVDYVDRAGSDFYAYDNQPGRTVTTAAGDVFDLSYITNDSNFYTRTYRGLHTNFQYRIGERWQLGAAWTLSKASGNFDGEGWNTGADPGGFSEYREYRQAEWNMPDGRLKVDQRHQLRAWGVWDAISSKHHSLSVSALFNYWSGQNFSNVGTVDVAPYVTNPGYQTPPPTMTYYFGERGGESWDDLTRTDLGVNYGFTFAAGVQFFVQLDVLNVFNRQGQVGGNTTIRVFDTNEVVDENGVTRTYTFNPFEEQPVQGVHWGYGPYYREPISESSYQTPREYRVSLGVRF